MSVLREAKPGYIADRGRGGRIECWWNTDEGKMGKTFNLWVPWDGDHCSHHSLVPFTSQVVG
jgi:hypothetical protein